MSQSAAAAPSHIFLIFSHVRRNKNLRLCSSSEKMHGAGTEIPLDSIEYVQIGGEDIVSEHSALEAPYKTLSNSPASIYISAGRQSVRIRMPDSDSAAAIAQYLKQHIYRRGRDLLDDHTM